MFLSSLASVDASRADVASSSRMIGASDKIARVTASR